MKCFIADDFEFDLLRFPENIVTLFAKIGGFASAMFGFAIIFRIYNSSKLDRYLQSKTVSVESLMETIAFFEKSRKDGETTHALFEKTRIDGGTTLPCPLN